MAIVNSNNHPGAGLTTLVDMLRRQAEKQPDEVLFTFLVDGESEESSITYGDLDRNARAIAAWLQDHHAEGERALLLYPPGLDYISAYFGCLYAGVIAVPAYPPRLNRPVPRIQGIVADSSSHFALTTSEILDNLEQRFEYTPDLQALTWLDTQQSPVGAEESWKQPAIGPDTLAFLQYTSGSTSQPKGVMVTHANLLYNLAQIWSGFRIYDYLGECRSAVSWLPTYHDMGLIGGILEPIFAGACSYLLSPLAFLQRPYRWLQAISRYQATVSGGPNFAYQICLEKIRPEQIENLDLSSWCVAFNGAEPIRRDTIERFSAAFAPAGFRSEVFYPCYGLAEATLFVTGAGRPDMPQHLTVHRDALERGHVVQAEAAAPDRMDLVCCGQPELDEQIVIANPEDLTRCLDGVVGEIWISGSNVTQGYWNRPEESQRTFRAYLLDTQEGPFLRTGDLGFMLDGSLFVTGRLKDMIIIRGTNHYPQDIEQTVEKSHPALQVGGGAAFSVTVSGDEELVVVQEVTRQARKDDMNEVFRAIRAAISENHDLQVYAMVLIRPLTVPKTSSGKIQRHAARNAYLQSNLEIVAEWRSRPADK